MLVQTQHLKLVPTVIEYCCSPGADNLEPDARARLCLPRKLEVGPYTRAAATK